MGNQHGPAEGAAHDNPAKSCGRNSLEGQASSDAVLSATPAILLVGARAWNVGIGEKG